VTEKTQTASAGFRYLVGAAAIVVIIAGLRAAKPLMVPFLLSIFLSILCVPAVTWLTRKRVPRGLAVLLVILGMLGILAGIGALVGNSIGQ
jgi:predicted PurR-regulated permease PerM